MRSSKNRSRSKGNRNRPSGGNIVNRVFDSSGPEGKVRGTPQQIIDKYNQLVRDAQLSNDRVAAENFAQHAEHYTRMLAEAQREQDAKREQHDAQQQNQQRNRDDRDDDTRQNDNRQNDTRQNENRQDDNRQDRNDGGQRSRSRSDNNDDAAEGEAKSDPQGLGETIDTGTEAGLVETPEDKPKPNRRRRKPKAAADDGQPAADNSSENQPAAE